MYLLLHYAKGDMKIRSFLNREYERIYSNAQLHYTSTGPNPAITPG